MSDGRLRELERRWRLSGASADHAALLHERSRLGLPGPSSRFLDLLPHPAHIRRRWISLALLHALLGPETLVHPDEADDSRPTWDYVRDWCADTEVGTHSDHSGDQMFLALGPGAVYLQGFDHESPMSPWRTDPPKPWPGLLEGLPPPLTQFVEEPAFQARKETTFLLWWLPDGKGWRTGVHDWATGQDPDGSRHLLSPLMLDAIALRQELSDNFEREVEAAPVAAVLSHDPLTEDLARALRPDAEPEIVLAHAIDLGYSSTGPV